MGFKVIINLTLLITTIIVHLFTCRFGCTKVVISDQGFEFVSRVNEQLLTLTGTRHRISTSYHPQTNGFIERFNQTVQRALLKPVKDEQDILTETYTSILSSLNTRLLPRSRQSGPPLKSCTFGVLHAHLLPL